jgi:hypothetical protein
MQAYEPVVRRPALRRARHVVVGAVAVAVALVGILALVRTSGHTRPAARLATGSWSWNDQPMTVNPADAAVQAASLAHVANDGFQAEQLKLAKLRMAQVGELSGERPSAAHAQSQRAAAAAPAQPFAPEIAQRLQAVDGAAQDAQAAAMQVIGRGPLSGRLHAWSASSGATGYLSSNALSLPTRTTRNGLALDYFHLDSLPAATAVRFAKREVDGAMAKPASPPAGLLSVDQKAMQAFEQGTDIVVKRRQRAGILPMPINKAWKYENQKVKEAVGDNVVNAQRAVANAHAGTVAKSASKRSAEHVSTPSSVAPEASDGRVHAAAEQNKLKKLEAEVKSLKAQKEMEDQLNSLQSKEAKLEREYPKLIEKGG